MLHIAVIGRDYPDALEYIKTKYEGQIATITLSHGRVILINGDVLYTVYGDPNKFIGCRFDAFVRTPNHRELVEVISDRCGRVGA